MVGEKGQIAKIKQWLEQGKVVTSWEAYELWGCTRLAARIFDLRQSGMDIRTTTVEALNRYDEPVRYAMYKLVMKK